jgi:hypothetical protein
MSLPPAKRPAEHAEGRQTAQLRDRPLLPWDFLRAIFPAARSSQVAARMGHPLILYTREPPAGSNANVNFLLTISSLFIMTAVQWTGRPAAFSPSLLRQVLTSA